MHGESRVAQRYIVGDDVPIALAMIHIVIFAKLTYFASLQSVPRQENPVCYNGRKVDSRCLVMMASANPQGKPTLLCTIVPFSVEQGTRTQSAVPKILWIMRSF